MSRPSVEQAAAEFFRVLSNVAGDPDDSLYDEQDSIIRQFEEAARAVLDLFEPETVTTAADLWDECGECGGVGWDEDGRGVYGCPDCHGRGYIERSEP